MISGSSRPVRWRHVLVVWVTLGWMLGFSSGVRRSALGKEPPSQRKPQASVVNVFVNGDGNKENVASTLQALLFLAAQKSRQGEDILFRLVVCRSVSKSGKPLERAQHAIAQKNRELEDLARDFNLTAGVLDQLKELPGFEVHQGSQLPEGSLEKGPSPAAFEMSAKSIGKAQVAIAFSADFNPNSSDSLLTLMSHTARQSFVIRSDNQERSTADLIWVRDHQRVYHFEDKPPSFRWDVALPPPETSEANRDNWNLFTQEIKQARKRELRIAAMLDTYPLLELLRPELSVKGFFNETDLGWLLSWGQDSKFREDPMAFLLGKIAIDDSDLEKDPFGNFLYEKALAGYLLLREPKNLKDPQALKAIGALLEQLESSFNPGPSTSMIEWLEKEGIDPKRQGMLIDFTYRLNPVGKNSFQRLLLQAYPDRSSDILNRPPQRKGWRARCYSLFQRLFRAQ